MLLIHVDNIKLADVFIILQASHRAGKNLGKSQLKKDVKTSIIIQKI